MWISEFGVPAVDHKIACDWERLGIKSLLRVASNWVFRRSPCFEKENCGHKDFYVRQWGFVQSLAAVAVHISCRNRGRGFALRIIAIVQVRMYMSCPFSTLSFSNIDRRSSMSYCRYGIPKKTSGKNCPQNDNCTEICTIQPCRKRA